MTIKEARLQAGLTRVQMSELLGIPIRTIQDWELDKRVPSEWVKRLIIQELNRMSTQSNIRNSSVKEYAEICKKFANDAAEWGEVDEYKFYTTNGSDWEETCDNSHNGVDVSWAFHLSADEIEQRAAEELYEQLMNEIYLANSDGWDSKNFKTIYDKFNFDV